MAPLPFLGYALRSDPMNAIPIVDIHSLTKDYGRRRAVDKVSLRIAAGEVFGLLGPNGSGKSTLLKMLTGLLAPSAGSAAVKGFDVGSQGREARRLVGYVPEDSTLYPQMLVNEFLRFMGHLRGVARSRLPAALEAVIATLDLAGVQRLAIGKLSHGYRQRVLIAQALINDPPLLILDEPTNGLDPHQIIELRELIKRLAPRHTILVTSHILGEIERVATRVGILLNGRLLTDSVVVCGLDRVILHAIPPAGVVLRELLDATPEVEVQRELQRATLGTAFELRLVSSNALLILAHRLRATQCAVLELSPVSRDLEARFLALTARAGA